jgi:ligand-binding SRPBCC domain-containing protein
MYNARSMPYRLETRCLVPAPLPSVFEFFSDARSFETLTPPFLHFRMLTPEVEMRVGAHIDYRCRLRGLPLRWQSEITAWEPGIRFRNEQRRGPYRYWRHLHLFNAEKGGTVVEDAVDYDVTGGRFVHDWIVAPELVRIFRRRQEKIEGIFGPSPHHGVKISIQRKL